MMPQSETRSGYEFSSGQYFVRFDDVEKEMEDFYSAEMSARVHHGQVQIHTTTCFR